MPKKTALEKLAAATVSAFERKEHRPNVHFELSKAELVDEANRKLNWNLFGAVKEVPLELNITGASVVKLVCEDPQGELLNDPIFSKWMFEKQLVSKSTAKTYTSRKITDSSKTAKYGEESEEEWILPTRPIDLNLDGIWFRLAGFRVQETTLTLIFEDRVAAILRREVGRFLTVNRGSMTRAQFIQKLAKEAEHNHRNYGKIPTFIPEATIAQKIAAPTSEAPSDLKSSAARVLTTSDGITVKGVPATEAQLKILNIALEVAVELKAPTKAQVALVAMLIDENDVSNPDPGNSGDMGALSMTAETYASTKVNPFDIAAVCTYALMTGFGGGGLIPLSKEHPNLSAGELAHIEQGNADPNVYKAFEAESEHAVKVYGATEAGEGPTGATVAAPYTFSRGPNETSWDCIQRLASEVSWYAFVRENTLWYVSGNFLLAQEARLRVEKGKHGIDWVNPNIDIGARDNIAEIEVIGRAALWTAVSGNCVQVGRVGPANGKWVVNTVSLDVLDRSDAITVTLQKPLPARPEPAASGTVPAEGEEGAGGAGGANGSYVNPFSRINNLTPERVDMGVDYGGTGQIVAMGDATVFIATNSSAWPGSGFVGYTLTSGPYKGKHVYHAENIHISVSAGQQIKAGQVVGVMTDAYPFTESGWSSGNGEETLAASLNQQAPGDPGEWESAAGASFNRLLISLGCKSGVKQSGGPHGKMPAGYP